MKSERLGCGCFGGNDQNGQGIFGMKTRWIWILGLCAGLLWAAPEAKKEEKPSGEERVALVVSEAIVEGSMDSLGSFVGTLYFEDRSSLASEVSGVIEELLVKEGARVKKGEALARLNSDLLQKEIAAKESSLKQAKAQAAKVEKEFERLSKLHATQSVSFKEYEDALFDKEAQKSSAEAVASDLARLKSELGRKTLKAPYEGIILEKLLNPGEWVATGAAIFNMAKLSPMEASIEVPFETMKNLKVGDRVNLKVAQKEYPASIKALIPLGDSKARTFPVKIAIDNSKGELFEGLEARVRLKTQESASGLLVPRDSILPKNGQNVIFVLKEGKAKMINVEILAYEGRLALVKAKGISAGERVVIEGQERLRANQETQERQAQ
ncbi:MAG: efflux RND transporter periplasmic adaptor subunit [Wolinella succinogenes]|nr:efflux RND transporter periplasmic adaptor subunit [Wolinella succinogenes]